jgi:replicative DNA helicase
MTNQIPRDPRSEYDPRAEIALIGCMTIDPVIALQYTWVDYRWFSARYAPIWQAIQTLLKQGTSPDAVSIASVVVRTMILKKTNVF